MRLEITPNFITQEECALLNAWAYEGVVKKWLDVGISSGKLINKRLTSRLYGDRFEYPKEVIELSTKIRSFVISSSRSRSFFCRLSLTSYTSATLLTRFLWSSSIILYRRSDDSICFCIKIFISTP